MIVFPPTHPNAQERGVLWAKISRGVSVDLTHPLSNNRSSIFIIGCFRGFPALTCSSCFSELVIFRNVLHIFSQVLGLSLVFNFNFLCLILG